MALISSSVSSGGGLRMLLAAALTRMSGGPKAAFICSIAAGAAPGRQIGHHGAGHDALGIRHRAPMRSRPRHRARRAPPSRPARISIRHRRPIPELPPVTATIDGQDETARAIARGPGVVNARLRRFTGRSARTRDGQASADVRRPLMVRIMQSVGRRRHRSSSFHGCSRPGINVDVFAHRATFSGW